MKAISLWQPWASFMAWNLKRNETRARPTHHRGPLAICAAPHRVTSIRQLGHGATECLWSARARVNVDRGTVWNVLDALPFGRVLCVVNVQDCQRSEDVAANQSAIELQLGDYTPGRWIWLTNNCHSLAQPLPITGRPWLFDLPPEIEAEIRKQIPS